MDQRTQWVTIYKVTKSYRTEQLSTHTHTHTQTFSGNGHWQQSLERIASIGQKENFERAKPRIFIPTAGPILQKSHHSK